MIVNTGGRTDTVRFYTEWLLNRFREGHVLSRNPLFPNTVTRYELDPSVVDCVVFCSKDYRPILPHLSEITDRFGTYFHYTITPYGRDVEPNIPPAEEMMDALVSLSSAVGRQRVAWRYDPVLLTDTYTVDWHLDRFERMCGKLAPHVDRCIFSFVEMHRRVLRRMPELVPMTEGDRERLAEGMGSVAADHGMTLQTCGTGADLSRHGIRMSGCMTLDIIGRANGVSFAPRKHRGTRSGCGCIESRDIGAYDTCPGGCRYCYANSDPGRVADNMRRHDPASPLLIGYPEGTDRIVQGTQKPFRRLRLD